MKKVLFIAPSSIPVMNAEAIVNVKLLKVLVEDGWQVDLLSKRVKWKQYPVVNEKDLGFHLGILRQIEVSNKITLYSVILHFLSFLKFGTVYRGAHWAYLAVREAEKLIRENSYDLVITKSYPSELAGYYLKKKYGLKWVATWNDPFPMERYPVPYGKGPEAKLPWFSRRLISIMEKYPDYHVFPSARLRNYMHGYLNVDEKKLKVIPHVVTDIREKEEFPVQGCLRLVHSGNLSYPRDPENLFRALGSFNATGPRKIYLDVIGIPPTNIQELLEKYKLEKAVRVLPPMKYTESLEILKDYHLAVIIEAPCKEGIFLPTKVGDYMQHRKNIFAISPQKGELNDLYQKGFIKYFADCTAEEDILKELNRIAQDYEEGNLNTACQIPSDYTASSVTGEYNTLF